MGVEIEDILDCIFFRDIVLQVIQGLSTQLEDVFSCSEYRAFLCILSFSVLVFSTSKAYVGLSPLCHCFKYEGSMYCSTVSNAFHPPLPLWSSLEVFFG